MFSNLAQNAYEAMLEGGVLTIGIESVDSTMRVSLQDNGEGIREEDVGRVFDPPLHDQGTGDRAGVGRMPPNYIEARRLHRGFQHI